MPTSRYATVRPFAVSNSEATTHAIEDTDMLMRAQNMPLRPLHIPERPCLVGMLCQQINLMFYLMSLVI